MSSGSMSRREFVKTGLGLAAAASFGGCAQFLTKVHAPRPNVIFIICDDLNDAVVNMGRYPQAQTPNLARLMNQGTRFSHAYCTVPLCGPSRACLLSGLAPWRTGYYVYDQHHNNPQKFPILKDAKTFMEHFMSHGYDVYGSGKIFHNGYEKYDVWKRKEDGFDGFRHYPSWGPAPWDGKTVSGPLKEMCPHPGMPAPLRIGWEGGFGPLSQVPHYPPDPKTGSPGCDGWVLYNQPFRYVSDDDRDKMPDELGAEYAAEVIRGPHTKPFMFTLGFNRPHTPLYVPQKYFDRYPLDTINLPPHLTNDLDDIPDALRRNQVTGEARYGFWRFEMLKQVGKGSDEWWKRWLQAYLACVTFMDDQLGKVLDALDQSGHWQDTLVIFTSDNAYHMGEKRYLFKDSLWEESLHIPLVIAGPGVARGGVCDQPVTLLDLYPTMVDFCGLPHNPNGERWPLDGASLMPLARHPRGAHWAGPAMAVSVLAGDDPVPSYHPGKLDRQHYSIRSRQWRYTLCADGSEELYDHLADPHEWRNRSADPVCRKVKHTMREALRKTTGR